MKKLLFILPFITCFVCCGQSIHSDMQTTNNTLDTFQTAIKVYFNKEVCLIWDTIEKKIVKNEDYKAILKDKNKLNIIINSVMDSVDIGVKACSKNSSTLKKGDIAFLFLVDNGFIHWAECLKMQFCTPNDDCGFFYGAFDYIDKNRDKVQKQVKWCIERNSKIN